MKAVILAGGSGTRLWPLSRINKPKQFQKLISNKTMLQETIARLDFLKPEQIYISTNEQYAKIVRDQSKGKIPASNIIVEPALRDTAPCIGLAAVYMGQQDPTEVMSVIYADHLVQKKTEFVKKLKIAEELARAENTLNIIEVKAKFPNINLGYVKIGKCLKEVKGVEIFAFEKFVEKPDLQKARAFLQSYKYLWNTGFYVWRIDTILKKFKQYLPDTYQQLMKIAAKLETRQEYPTLKNCYARCDKISIDYGIMEKIDRREVRIIPAELGWSDVGTWESIFSELIAQEQNNLIRAPHIGLDTEGCLIYAEGKKVISTIGLKNMVIVETPDAILICPKDRSHDVKKLVEKIQKSSYRKLL